MLAMEALETEKADAQMMGIPLPSSRTSIAAIHVETRKDV